MRSLSSFDQTFAQRTFSPQARLEAAHLAAVALVIVAKQMEQPVKREDAQLGRLGMARVARLTA